MQQKLKERLIGVFAKFIEQPKIEKKLVELIWGSEKANKNITNGLNPYFSHTSNAAISERDDIVFVTSRFRSGSTLLWNLFRETGLCTSYYEPFNERRWFDSDLRGENIDKTHLGVANYWAEFDNMEDLDQFFEEDWIRHNLMMDESSINMKMKSYIEQLVSRANKRPVLQFNRIDFRLSWIKQNFPNAKILHLYRHPRDQWCSFLTDSKVMNKDQVQDTYRDAFYLDLWCADLYKHFPILDKKITPHPYQRFYYLWKLSYLYGKQYSDLSISFENLTTDTVNVIGKIMQTIKLNNVPIEKLCNIVSPPAPERWKNYADEEWFSKHEKVCERNLNLILAKT